MIKNPRQEALAQFQFRTTIFDANESIKILEQFRWNCLEAINYVLNDVDSIPKKSSNTFDEPLLPKECLNEVEGIRHFERRFQHRYSNVPRWPVWLKSSLENAINQSHGPFAIFLNHDKSPFTSTFSRRILCSPSILNVLIDRKCSIWPWDITYSSNKQRLLERSGRARHVLSECLSHFHDVRSYPLLIILGCQKDQIVLLDIVNGNSDLDQARACLERTLNPVHEQSTISNDETASLSPGWIGGRTPGNIRRRPCFVTTFRLARSVRLTHQPRYISFYERNISIPEVVVSTKEAQQWLNKKNLHHFTPKDVLSPKAISSPIPSLSLSNKEQRPFIYMSPRRAGWAPMLHR